MRSQQKSLVTQSSGRRSSLTSECGGQALAYFQTPERGATSWLFVLPLWFTYQLLVVRFPAAMNGVDFLSGPLSNVAGVIYDPLMLLVFCVGTFLLFRSPRQRRRTLLPRFGLTLGESMLYAGLLGVLVSGALTAMGVSPSPSLSILATGRDIEAFALSLGAGFYEETAFRWLGVGGGLWLISSMTRARPGSTEARWDRGLAVTLTVLVSAVLFSGAHFVGECGDFFSVYSFLYRLLAGILFGVIYYVRGLAVAVYTHAFYDVFVLMG